MSPVVASPRPTGMATVAVGTTTWVGMSLDVRATRPIIIASSATFHLAASRKAFVNMSALCDEDSMYSSESGLTEFKRFRVPRMEQVMEHADVNPLVSLQVIHSRVLSGPYDLNRGGIVFVQDGL